MILPLWTVAAEAAEARVAPPPAGFTDLRGLPGLAFQIAYATPDNFTGAPLPGYEAAGAWLRDAPAQALVRVAAALSAEGYGLLIYDAYRPERASRAMVAWTEQTHQQHLIAEGYIAARSMHNRGVAVDLTLTRGGVPVEMGTPFDAFTTESHTRNASGLALENRLRLAGAMKVEGFVPYPTEWWHFQYSGDAAPIDVPYAMQR